MSGSTNFFQLPDQITDTVVPLQESTVFSVEYFRGVEIIKASGELAFK
jgi:hypothetical protein